MQALADLNLREEYIYGWLFEERNPAILNGFRAPDLEKIADMVLYFAKYNTPLTPALNKLLFYADFGHYNNYGYSISGMCYKAMERGPVPENNGGIYNYVLNTGKVSVEEIAFGDNVGERFVANFSAEPDSLTEEESATMKMVSEKFKGLSAKQIIDLSNEEPAWKNKTDADNRISFDYAFELKNIESRFILPFRNR